MGWFLPILSNSPSAPVEQNRGGGRTTRLVAMPSTFPASGSHLSLWPIPAPQHLGDGLSDEVTAYITSKGVQRSNAIRLGSIAKFAFHLSALSAPMELSWELLP